MMSSKKVIIIGAGAAGIAAATRLYENGITDVLVLEAENRIGGRVYTLDVEGDGGFIEIGAQWVHGEQMNVVYELASPRNLLTISGAAFENLLFVQSSAQIVSSKISAKMLELFDTVVDDIDVDVHEYETSGEYFIEKIQKLLQEKNIEINETLKEQFIEWFHQLINLLDASDSWFDSAASTLTEYWECAGNELISWKEHGYRSIFSILMEKSEALSNGNFSKQNIINNSEVIQITPYENGARIKCDDDTEYFADHVIVTLSLGVLKEKFDILFPCDVITDKKRQAIKNLQIGTVDKLYLRFPYKWWPEKIDGISLLWSEEHRLKYDKKGLKWLTDIFSFSIVDNNPLMLCGWIVGSSARTMESIDETLVKSQLTQLLRDLLGHVYKIPEPNWFFRSTWQSNNHFRGSYSFRTPSCDKLKISATDLATPYVNKDDIPTILFAGEATHEHFYSTVHGAIETGWREADRILSLTPKSSTK